MFYGSVVGDRVGDTEDRLGELCLEQEHQISVLECTVGLVNKPAKSLLHQPVSSHIFRDFCCLG